MPTTFSKQIDSPVYKGEISLNTGLFINGEFVDSIEKGTTEYVS